MGLTEILGFLLSSHGAWQRLGHQMPRRSSPTSCRCGAPLLPGAHFCSHCGRPSEVARPVLTCAHCGQPLPADTNFCAFCGNPVAAGELAAEPDLDDTAVPRWSAGEDG